MSWPHSRHVPAPVTAILITVQPYLTAKPRQRHSDTKTPEHAAPLARLVKPPQFASPIPLPQIGCSALFRSTTFTTVATNVRLSAAALLFAATLAVDGRPTRISASDARYSTATFQQNDDDKARPNIDIDIIYIDIGIDSIELSRQLNIDTIASTTVPSRLNRDDSRHDSSLRLAPAMTQTAAVQRPST